MYNLKTKSKSGKSLLLCILSSVITTGVHLLNFIIVPAIIYLIENRAEEKNIIFTVVIFIFALFVLKVAGDYISKNNENANKRVHLIACTAEFIIYLLILSFSKPFTIFPVLLISAINYSVQAVGNKYILKNNNEGNKYTDEIKALSEGENDRKIAADIKIFGLRPWIEETAKKAADSYAAIQSKSGKINVAVKITDLVLSFLRTGIVYAILVKSIVEGNLSAAEFLLLFSAAGGLSELTERIPKAAYDLRRENKAFDDKCKKSEKGESEN